MRRLVIIFCLFIPFLAMPQTEINLNAVEKKQLNTFFSNFSEAGLKSFKQSSLTHEVLLNFALSHIYKNAEKLLKRSKDGVAATIPAALVDKTTEKYFGQKIQRHEKSEYLVPLASGEADIFSQITRLLRAGKDFFLAPGVIYMTGSGGTPEPHGTPEAWKKAGEEVEQLGKFSALIKKAGTGPERYILVEYHVVMNNP